MARVLLDLDVIKALKRRSCSPVDSSLEIDDEKNLNCFICHNSDETLNDLDQKNDRKLVSSSFIDTDSTSDANGSANVSLTVEGNKIRKCSYPLCTIRFHENCFLNFTEGDFLPRFNILDQTGDPVAELKLGKRWFCPQHECNFCHQELLRTRSRQGRLIRCVDCIFAWHPSCVIVGSHHVDRKNDQFILCPRHNELKKTAKKNVPFCVKCDKKFEQGQNSLECISCIRSFCITCISKVRGMGVDENGILVCDFCKCYDFPRIGSHVLALFRGKFWPAKTVHADQLPQSLFSQQSFVKKLEEPGYVLIQWVEDLKVPNYAVVTFRDIVPFPKSVDCAFWERFNHHPRIKKVVNVIYADPDAAVGINRPLPDEVTEEQVPKYVKIKTNINMRLARACSDGEIGVCNCQLIDNKRCTVSHRCINRALMAECPPDCDQKFLEKIKSQNIGTKRTDREKKCDNPEVHIPPTTAMCANNFLRNRNPADDYKLLIEKPAKFKGFGVYAKSDIASGTDLTEYVGRVMTKEEYFKRLQFLGSFNNLEMSYFGMQLTNDYFVDARNCGSIARSFNHSCNPNCKVDAITVDGIYRLKVSTIRKVLKGEELCYDYDTQIADGLVGMKCYCKSENCRSVIGKMTGTMRKVNSKKESDATTTTKQIRKLSKMESTRQNKNQNSLSLSDSSKVQSANKDTNAKIDRDSEQVEDIGVIEDEKSSNLPHRRSCDLNDKENVDDVVSDEKDDDTKVPSRKRESLDISKTCDTGNAPSKISRKGE